MRSTHHRKNDPNRPHAQSIHREGHIVNRRHDGADFGERRVVSLVWEDLLGVAVAQDADLVAGHTEVGILRVVDQLARNTYS